ncbi:MAG: flippase activity-associated protein Agl23, partial [Chloroflexota bacterium]
HAYTLNWEAITYIVIFVLAAFTRLYDLGDRVMSHDESLHTNYSYQLARDGNFQHTPLMHGPILFHFTAMFYFLFGANDFTSRLYTAILGIAIVMMPLLFRRWLGKWGALLSSIMLLISPITLYYNRYIRHDTPNIFFSLLMIYGMFMYLSGPENQRRREHWLYLIAGAMIMNLGSKETAFIYIAIFGIYLAVFWFVRLAAAAGPPEPGNRGLVSLLTGPFRRFAAESSKGTFYSLIMAFCVGGVAALGMFVTLSINLG